MTNWKHASEGSKYGDFVLGSIAFLMASIAESTLYFCFVSCPVTQRSLIKFSILAETLPPARLVANAKPKERLYELYTTYDFQFCYIKKKLLKFT